MRHVSPYWLLTVIVLPAILVSCAGGSGVATPKTIAPTAAPVESSTPTIAPSATATSQPTPDGATAYDARIGAFIKTAQGKTYQWIPIQINSNDSAAGHWFESRIAGADSMPLLDAAANPYNPALSLPSMLPMQLYFIEDLRQLTSVGYLYHPDGTAYYAVGPGNDDAWLAKGCSMTSAMTRALARRVAGRDCGKSLCEPTSDEQTKMLKALVAGSLTLPFDVPYDTGAKADAGPRAEYKWNVSKGYSVYVINWEDADPAQDAAFAESEAGYARFRWKVTGRDGQLVALIATSSQAQIKDTDFLYGVLGGMGAVIANAHVDTGRYAFYESEAGNPSGALGKCSVTLVSTGKTAHALAHIELLDVNVTPTPEPTRTPRPLVPVEIVFPNMTVIKTESFKSNQPDDWWLDPAAVKVQGGALQIEGSRWLANAMYKPYLRQGSAVVMNYKYAAGTTFAPYLDTGDFGQPTYKRFGVFVENNGLWSDIFKGSQHEASKQLTGNFVTYPDTWYSLLLAIGKDGRFSLRVWDPTDPRDTIQYDQAFPAYWSDLNWRFTAGVDKGLLSIDDFAEANLDLP